MQRPLARAAAAPSHADSSWLHTCGRGMLLCVTVNAVVPVHHFTETSEQTSFYFK